MQLNYRQANISEHNQLCHAHSRNFLAQVQEMQMEDAVRQQQEQQKRVQQAAGFLTIDHYSLKA